MTREEWHKKRAAKSPRFAKRLARVAKQMNEIMGSGFVDRKIFQERIKLCKECEFFTKWRRCTKCGCFMDNKARYNLASCPVGKWEAKKGDKDGKKKND